VSASEQLIIASLAKYNVSTHSKAKAPGVYTPNGAKIASLGFKLKQHYSYHGLAVNIDCHLDGFERIDPCGCPGQTMTSLAIEQPAITKPKQSYRETLLALLPDYFRL
jgi:lipoyl(octanoyl) transferase